MNNQFDKVAAKLATEQGGFTLWLGAGVSRAMTRGKTPGWGELVDLLTPASDTRALAALARDSRIDFPERLEAVVELIGHERFCRALREFLISPLKLENIDLDVCIDMAMIGSRASAFVSFNLEELTAVPFVLTRANGNYCVRVFAQQLEYEHRLNRAPEPGPVTIPVYFPHGLLSHGRVALTRSEYDELQAGVAMMTAINVALGSSLVILGMSLDDSYLRKEILNHRRWFQNVYWFNDRFTHTEWARVAHVTTIQIAHDQLWRGLSEAFVLNDSSNRLERFQQKVTELMPEAMAQAANGMARFVEYGTTIEPLVRDHLGEADYAARLRRFFCDAGLGVPEWLENACRRASA